MAHPLELAVEQTIDSMQRSKRTSDFFNDPAAWAEYMLDMKLWSKQKEIADSVVVNKSTAVKAGHGVGKSFLVAVLACWWVDTRYPNAIVASTAPSVQQIGAIVWKEIRKLKGIIAKRYAEGLIDHELPGHINSDTKDNQWKAPDGVPIGFGKKPPDNKEDDSFQGIHDGYVLAIGDEACGLSGEIIDALGNITSNEGSRRILIANPTNPAAYFATLFRQDKGWTLHTISVFDSPNFTDERFSMSQDALDKLSGPSYVEDKKKEYGEDSARYKARVLGEFAFDQVNSLITPPDIAVGVDTDIIPSTATQPVLGVDVARFGEDDSVAYICHDGKLRFVDSWGKAGAPETANRIDRIAREHGVCEVRIDGTGIGGPIADIVASLAGGAYTVVAMNGGAASPDRTRWHNARAFWYDKTREMLRGQTLDIDIEDERLQDELMSIEYKFNKVSGGLLIEAKDDMRARGMKSPDFADAAIYACADMTEILGGQFAGMNVGDQVRFDPAEVGGDAGWMNLFEW